MTPTLNAIKDEFKTFGFYDGTVKGPFSSLSNDYKQISHDNPMYFLTIMEHDGGNLTVIATSRQTDLYYTQKHTAESVRKYLYSVMIMGI